MKCTVCGQPTEYEGFLDSTCDHRRKTEPIHLDAICLQHHSPWAGHGTANLLRGQVSRSRCERGWAAWRLTTSVTGIGPTQEEAIRAMEKARKAKDAKPQEPKAQVDPPPQIPEALLPYRVIVPDDGPLRVCRFEDRAGYWVRLEEGHHRLGTSGFLPADMTNHLNRTLGTLYRNGTRPDRFVVGMPLVQDDVFAGTVFIVSDKMASLRGRHGRGWTSRTPALWTLAEDFFVPDTQLSSALHNASELPKTATEGDNTHPPIPESLRHYDVYHDQRWNAYFAVAGDHATSWHSSMDNLAKRVTSNVHTSAFRYPFRPQKHTRLIHMAVPKSPPEIQTSLATEQKLATSGVP